MGFKSSGYCDKIIIQILVYTTRGRLNFSVSCKHFNHVLRKYFPPTARQYLRCFQRQRMESAKYILLRNIFPFNFHGNIPLRKFSEWGDHQTVRLLLNDKKGANVVDPSVENNHALKRAVELGHEKVTSILIQDSRVDLNFDGHFVMKTCCEKGNDAILRQVLFRHFDIFFHQQRASRSSMGLLGVDGHLDLGHSHTGEYTASVDCSDGSDLEVVTDGQFDPATRLHTNVDPVEFVTVIESCFIIASRFGHLKILKTFVEVETDPYRRGDGSKVETPFEIRIPKFIKNKALGWSIRNGHLSCLRFLLKFPDVQPNHLSDLPLRAACLYGRSEIAKILLSKKCVIPCSCEHVAISNAVICGYDDIVDLLLNDRRCREHTLYVIKNNHLLNLATRFGRMKLAKLFFYYLRSEKEFEKYSIYMEPVLLTCCKYSRVSMFQYIINKSSAKEIEKFNFEEMLLCTVRYRSIQLVRFLVNHYYESIRRSIFDVSLEICHEFRRERIRQFLTRKIPTLRDGCNVYYKTRVEGENGKITRKKEREDETEDSCIESTDSNVNSSVHTSSLDSGGSSGSRSLRSTKSQGWNSVRSRRRKKKKKKGKKIGVFSKGKRWMKRYFGKRKRK